MSKKKKLFSLKDSYFGADEVDLSSESSSASEKMKAKRRILKSITMNKRKFISPKLTKTGIITNKKKLTEPS